MSSDISSEGTRRLTSPHQRCDAKRPCTMCVKGDKADKCVYERQQPRPIPTIQTSAKGFSWPPIGPHQTLLVTWSDLSESASPPPSLTPYERPSSPTARFPWELSPRIYNQIGPRPSSDVSVVQSTCGTVERVPRLPGSSFTILPSIHFQTIPRPLRIPLSFVPPEHMQVSSVTESELDMTLCVFSPIYWVVGC